jgi:hypothetical protein
MQFTSIDDFHFEIRDFRCSQCNRNVTITRLFEMGCQCCSITAKQDEPMNGGYPIWGAGSGVSELVEVHNEFVNHLVDVEYARLPEGVELNVEDAAKAILAEARNGSCPSCGSHDVTPRAVNGSDPSVGYYADDDVVASCGRCRTVSDADEVIVTAAQIRLNADLARLLGVTL